MTGSESPGRILMAGPGAVGGTVAAWLARAGPGHTRELIPAEGLGAL